MRFLLFNFSCGKCNTTIKSPFGTFEYGQFLLRSKNDHLTYLNTFEDPVFDEVKVIFDALPITNAPDYMVPDFFQKIFGEVACDTDPEGGFYQIGSAPFCPVGCGVMEHFSGTDPAEHVSLDVPNVTHCDWEKLSNHEKEIRVETVFRLHYPDNFGY